MYMHIYTNNPTVGETDGTQVSEGTGLSPITIAPLSSANNEESSPVKLALRCESGYATAAETTIALTGTTAEYWALAQDNAGEVGTFGNYGASLTLPSGIGATNTLFWAKAKAVSSETPSTDTSVKFNVTCSAVANT